MNFARNDKTKCPSKIVLTLLIHTKGVNHVRGILGTWNCLLGMDLAPKGREKT